MVTNLAKISLSSCSDTNWPKFATKSVEQGGLLTPNPGWEDDDPTGEAKAGLGRKCGKDAACTEVRAVGCGNDIGGCNHNSNQLNRHRMCGRERVLLCSNQTLFQTIKLDKIKEGTNDFVLSLVLTVRFTQSTFKGPLQNWNAILSTDFAVAPCHKNA